jgi:site-specific recombinase XerD
MKPTDFSKYLTDFLMKYLINEQGASQNTIKSYRDTFVQFISYMEMVKGVKVQKLTLSSITHESVLSFLDWIQTNKKCSITTRNNRLAAIHSFFRYVQYHFPDNLYEFQRILSIKIKKHTKKHINFLTLDGIRLLLSQPNTSSPKGRRDLALLSLMYDTGARVQEIADISVNDIHLETPYTVRITGKGRKVRIVPLVEEQTKILRNYMMESELLLPQNRQNPLFFNNWNEPLTRGGISHILLKYVCKARECDSSLIPDNISCHSLRHSKAMHLLQAGVNLVYIRDILGHVSIQTTEVYARADSKLKREAIEKAYSDVTPKIKPVWENNHNLLDWLKSF